MSIPAPSNGPAISIPSGGFTGSLTADPGGFSSLIASLNGPVSAGALPTTTDQSSSAATLAASTPLSTSSSPTPFIASSSSSSPSSPSSPSNLSSLSSSSSSSSSPTASKSSVSLATITNASTTFITSTTVPQAASGTASPAQSSAAAVSKEHSCNSLSCSAGLKAAVAVPIVAVVLGLLLCCLFCARRRKRDSGSETGEARPTKAKKKWSRHLRVFSFDAELLMGGRFSSTNSIRTRSAQNSLRNGGGSTRTEPSLHSVDEVAPPYKDHVTHATPAMSQVGTGALAGGALVGGALASNTRPVSSATAPPPYKPGEAAKADSPTLPATGRNPFSDSAPVSPIEDSPFNDPPEDSSMRHKLSNNSMYDAASSAGVSEVASIRQAAVGRHLSVASGGRTVQVRNGSPPSLPDLLKETT